ncbi:hypothetical protein [Micromonospora sp. NPDC004551]|uniref:hypothetical protein n=1 Tax=Micromonospora sp. NPDC004551 TaxID=3154284 RepID=UPI0033A5E195
MAATSDQDPERMPFLRNLTTVLTGLAPARRAASAVLALVTAVAVVFAAPAPAMAQGDDFANVCASPYVSCRNGVEAGLVEGQCMTANGTGNYTQVCVRYDGDYVYVRDGQADGHAAIGEIAGGDGNIITRLCRNPFGYGTWAKCNFDWTESGTKFVTGGYFENRNQLAGQLLWQFSGN